jgi:hypothetical protein
MGNSNETMQRVPPSVLVFSASVEFNLVEWYDELVRLHPMLKPSKISPGLQISIENAGRFIVKNVEPTSGTYYPETVGDRTLYLALMN